VAYVAGYLVKLQRQQQQDSSAFASSAAAVPALLLLVRGMFAGSGLAAALAAACMSGDEGEVATLYELHMCLFVS
jgi:hypothetical protein